VFTAAPFCVTLRLMTRSRFSNVTVLLSNVSGTAKCDTSASVIALTQQAQLNAGSTMRVEKSSFATSMKAGSGIVWGVRFFFGSGIAQRSSLTIADSRFDMVSVTCITWGLSLGGSVQDNSTLSLVNTRITATCETAYVFQLEANSVAEGLFNVTGSEVTANGAQTSMFWTAANGRWRQDHGRGYTDSVEWGCEFVPRRHAGAGLLQVTPRACELHRRPMRGLDACRRTRKSGRGATQRFRHKVQQFRLGGAPGECSQHSTLCDRVQLHQRQGVGAGRNDRRLRLCACIV
jgi:hypothetical protein